MVCKQHEYNRCRKDPEFVDEISRVFRQLSTLQQAKAACHHRAPGEGRQAGQLDSKSAENGSAEANT